MPSPEEPDEQHPREKPADMRGVRDPARDLSRIPLSVRTDAAHMEVFTISIEPDSAGGVLRARWGSLDVWAPFEVEQGVAAATSTGRARTSTLRADS